MTIEEMWQKANETRKVAKSLQHRLQDITDLDERKLLAQQMNELFAQAKSLRDEVKYRRGMDESIEREFLCLQAHLEDD